MTMMHRIAVYALTRPAAELAARLAEALNRAQGTGNPERGTGNADIYLPAALAQELGGYGFSRLRDLLDETFQRYAGHVFLTAAGIAVRGIAPLLRGKDRDPAVVVLDQRVEFAVSLLSGRLGVGIGLAW